MFRRCAVNSIYFRFVVSSELRDDGIDYHINLLRNVACSRQVTRDMHTRRTRGRGRGRTWIIHARLERSSKRLIEPILIAS